MPAGIAGDFHFLKRCEWQGTTRTGRQEFSCGNLKLIRFGDCVTITKSLATFLNGDNRKLLDCKQLSEALEKLSVELGINCFKCNLHGVDFTLMCPVCCPPESYFQFFVERRGHYRKDMEHGFYLQHRHNDGTPETKKNYLYVYDKSHNGEQWLRMEERICGGIPTQLNVPNPAYSEDLSTQDCFDRCADFLHTELREAIVLSAPTPLMPKKLSLKSAKEIAWELCLANNETREEFERIFEEYDRDGLVNKNFGPKLKKLLAEPHSLEEDSRLTELHSKIESAFEDDSDDT